MNPTIDRSVPLPPRRLPKRVWVDGVDLDVGALRAECSAEVLQRVLGHIAR